MLEQIFSVQDMIGIAIVIGVILKLFQFIQEDGR
jgi:hypothetical protein